MSAETTNDDREVLTRESCIEYALTQGYYTREQLEPLWADDDPQKFFDNYAELKMSDETSYRCQCGNGVVMAHPHFGVTFGFGPAGACTCDGKADLTKEIPRDRD